MWLLFDLVNPRIVNSATTPDQLRFEEDELPPHIAAIRRSRIEAIDDPLFLGVVKHWPELNLRRLYTWMKLDPPLTPSKMSEEALIELRLRIRLAIAGILGVEPTKLPTLEAYSGPVSVPQAAPPPPRLPNAQRGSVGPLIHRVATEMWEAEGSPKNTSTVLALRQKIMKVLLEEHKIKISTSSNELGRWQKQLTLN
jgi:hypothetical protein